MDIALYRKYRPQTFKEVLGQDHIIQALEGAIGGDSISHAYLFSGSRGTGKTSVARIFAKGIGVDEKDLYEIDAASNRGIDDVRELREAVNTLPFASPFKVYIIDEVHMLTKEAFNALLKTLEEPPKHAVFILATTEMHKLPETVISRCETHNFRRPSQQLLHDVVENIAKMERYTIEPAGAELIALLGDGSFRDAQGVLQKVLNATKGKKVSAENVASVTGAPSSALVGDIISALDRGNLDKGLSAVGKAVEQNVDMKVFMKLILHRLRAVLLLRFAKHMTKTLQEEMSEGDFKLLEGIVKSVDSKINASVLSEFLSAYEQIGHSYIPQLPIELALIKLLGHPEK